MATKIIHRLQLPYPAPEWPRISSEDDSTIVQHLVALLKPLGDHRRSHITPSKGKHSKKRKLKDVDREHNSDTKATIYHYPRPLMPSISNYVTIGFNSTSRSLEALSQLSKPAILQEVEVDAHQSEEKVSALGAVFVCRSALPDLLITSIPLVVATASLARLQTSPIRLVQLSDNAEGQLAEALHQPRVGFIGVQVDAPNSELLFAIVRAAVSAVQARWLDGSQSPRYLPAHIERIETSVESKEPKKAAKHPEQRTKDKSTKPASQSKVKKKSNT